MNITIETAAFFVTTMGTIIGGFVWLSGKLEDINKTIASVQKDYVEHKHCQERRDRCPCISELNELKEEFKTIKERGTK